MQRQKSFLLAQGRQGDIEELAVRAKLEDRILIHRHRSLSVGHAVGEDILLAVKRNRVSISGEGLDLAIRFGDGSWHGLDACKIMDAPLTPMCSPALAAEISDPTDLARHRLLRSYRNSEWERWFEGLGLPCPVLRGPVLDSSIALADMAAQGHGVAMLPRLLFRSWEEEGRLVQPCDHSVSIGSYWLTRPRSKDETSGMRSFKKWLLMTVRSSGEAEAE